MDKFMKFIGNEKFYMPYVTGKYQLLGVYEFADSVIYMLSVDVNIGKY